MFHDRRWTVVTLADYFGAPGSFFLVESCRVATRTTELERYTMRIGVIAIGLSLLLVAGCDRDQRGREKADGLHRQRWQIVQQPDAAAVWRLETTTGALSYCNADFTNRLVLCMPQAVASAGATT